MANESTSDTPLLFAVKNGDIEIVKVLLDGGVNIHVQDEDMYILLHNAIKNKEMEIIELLLNRGANVDVKDFFGLTPLHIATEEENVEIIELLLKFGANINSKDYNFFSAVCTPLHIAVEKGNEEIIKLLLSRGAYIDAEADNGTTPLHIAVDREYVQIVDYLLKHGACVNSEDEKGFTSLHLSAPIGNTLITKMLLNKGANVNVKKYNETPLSIACANGNKEVVELLLKCDAKFDDFEGNMSPFYMAVLEEHPELIETFLKFVVDIDSRDKLGRTALYIASEGGYKNIVMALLENGSDINFTTKNNYTPLQIALEFSDYSVLEESFYTEDDELYNQYCGCTEITEILKKRIVMMKTANLYVCEENLKEFYWNVELNDFQGQCEEEMKRIKSEKISNNIYFYDILTKSVNQLAAYARNENIVAVLKSYNYRTRFPIYSSIINSNFRKGIERKELLEQGYKSFHLLFNIFSELPYNCTEKILNHLSNKELRILIASCKTTDVGKANNSEQFLINNP